MGEKEKELSEYYHSVCDQYDLYMSTKTSIWEDPVITIWQQPDGGRKERIVKAQYDDMERVCEVALDILKYWVKGRRREKAQNELP